MHVKRQVWNVAELGAEDGLELLDAQRHVDKVFGEAFIVELDLVFC
jgi:hypothetical protein